MSTLSSWYNTIKSTVMEAGSRILGVAANPIQNVQSGIIGTIKGWFNRATTAATDLVTDAKQGLMKTIASTVIKTAVTEVETQVKQGLTSAGEQLGKGLADTVESVISGGSDALNTQLGSIGKRFREVLETFKEKIDVKEQENDKSAAEQLGINLAKILHEKLSDLGDACFQAKKMSLDAFKQSSTDAINRAKPALEKELGEAFVSQLLNPVISFLKNIFSSLLSSLSNFFGRNTTPTPAPVTPQVSPDVAVTITEELQEEPEIEVDSGIQPSR